VTPFTAKIEERLKKYPDITAQRVFEDLLDAGYTGKYTTIKNYLRRVRPRPVVEPSLPTIEHGPGEMSECDWTPCAIDFTDGTRAEVQVFGYVLVHSKRRNFLLYEQSDLHALMDGHVKTFERLEGLARQCKYDSQKPVVLRWEGRQPIYNPRYLAFAAHYEFRPVACRRGHPNDKPRVERSFWEYERSFLNGRSFRDLEDMRAQLRAWCERICDRRPHKKLKRPPIEMFAEEAPCLVPLPRHAYDTARVIYRVCSIDGYVAWDGNRYAVPYDFLYDILPIRITQREIIVYAPDLRVLASHELAPRSKGVDVGGDRLHRPSDRRGVDLDQLHQSFDDLGDHAAAYFKQLLGRGTRVCSFHARQVLRLRERYDTEDLTAALKQAHAFGALEHTAVERILEAKARPRTLAEYIVEQTTERIEQRLGREQTAPRDLAEYDRLPRFVTSTLSEDPCNERKSPNDDKIPPT
jgi:transposase